MSLRDRLRRLVRRLRPTGNVGERVAKSAIWVGGQNVFGRLLQLATLALLARLIGPEELGLVGIALLALSATRKLTNVGLNAALIQKVEDDVDTHLNTTWLLEFGRGALVFGVLFVTAPFVAETVFSAPRATDLIRAIGLSPLLLGVRNPGVVYFQKNLEFDKQFIYKLSGDVAQILLAVGYALVSPTAWAFVVGFVGADLVRTAVSYLIHGYRPWPSFDVEVARELIGYGKWLTGSSILYFIYSEGDDVFVGWFLTPTALAFYQYTYRFSNAPATELSQVVTSVMFPAFSKLQEDEEQLRSAFRRTLRMTALIAFPASVGIIAIAPTLVPALFGEAWLPAVPVMQVLAIYGLLRAVGRLFGEVWKTIGRPDIITKMSALRVVLIAILIYPLTDAFGIVGTAITVTGIYLVPMMPLDIYIVSRTLDMSVRELGYELAFPLVACLPMGLAVWWLRPQLPVGRFPTLGILIVFGVVLYVGTVLLLEGLSEWSVSGEVRNIARNAAS
jgi:PST family polysaccharide transporter/lipopolysaccharide exporter